MAWRSPGSRRPCQGSESQALAWAGAPWLRALVSQQDTHQAKALSPERDGNAAVCLSGVLGRVGTEKQIKVYHPAVIYFPEGMSATSPGKLFQWFNYSQRWETSVYYKAEFV